MPYTVGEMAKLLGITPSALRYYDKEGLLPFVKRSSGGMRIFEEKDYEWLQIIECLKHTGMPLKEIRNYIDLAMQGDKTIESRLQLFLNQREVVRKQIAALQEMLDMLDFKCWYYETAKAVGTTEIPRKMSLDEIPKQYREARKQLQHIPIID